MGFRPSSAGEAQSEVLTRVRSRDRWSDEINVSSSPEDDWEPALAVDNAGRAWIAWDSYRGPAAATGYDILLPLFGRQNGAGAFGFGDRREKPALEGEIAWSSPIFVRRK